MHSRCRCGLPAWRLCSAEGSVRPLDPRLLREVPAARRFLVACVLLATCSAAAIVAQAALLAHVVAGAFLGHRGLGALAVPLVALGAVSVARGALGWAFETGGSLAHVISSRLGSISRLSRADLLLVAGPALTLSVLLSIDTLKKAITQGRDPGAAAVPAPAAAPGSGESNA